MENVDRVWMYDKCDGRGAIKSSFVSGVDNFLQFARSQRHRMSGQKIRCPCKRCKFFDCLAVDTVRLHLFQAGFIENYFIWIHHGEKVAITETTTCAAQPEREPENPYRQMVMDIAGSNINQSSNWQSANNEEPGCSYSHEPAMAEDPNPESQRFYDVLQAADEKLCPGASLSQLCFPLPLSLDLILF